MGSGEDRDCRMTNALANGAIIAAAIIAPNIVIGPILGLLRLSSITSPENNFQRWLRYSFGWLTLAVGVTERAFALTLFICAPSALLPFIGGWMALKYAARWHEIYGERGRKETLIALVGTAWSFAIAIAAAYYIHPQSLGYFTGSAPQGIPL
jgi:hypothetical protein